MTITNRMIIAFSALKLFVGRQEEQLVCKKVNDEVLGWIGITFLVPACPGCPVEDAVKWVTA